MILKIIKWTATCFLIAGFFGGFYYHFTNGLKIPWSGLGIGCLIVYSLFKWDEKRTIKKTQRKPM